MPNVTMLSIKKNAGELEQLAGPAPSIAEGRGRARPATILSTPALQGGVRSNVCTLFEHLG
eukprot:6068730-Prymnesium_polylepis.1